MFFRTPPSLVTAGRGCVIMSWVHTGNTESTLDRGDAVSQKKKEKKREREKERMKENAKSWSDDEWRRRRHDKSLVCSYLYTARWPNDDDLSVGMHAFAWNVRVNIKSRASGCWPMIVKTHCPSKHDEEFKRSLFCAIWRSWNPYGWKYWNTGRVTYSELNH